MDDPRIGQKISDHGDKLQCYGCPYDKIVKIGMLGPCCAKKHSLPNDGNCESPNRCVCCGTKTWQKDAEGDFVCHTCKEKDNPRKTWKN